MLIFGLFEQSIELEQALAELEGFSVLNEQILIVFMDQNKQGSNKQHPPPHDFEVGVACATGAAVIGASLGFTLMLGPILCGIIGAFTGFIIGLAVSKLFKKAKYHKTLKESRQQVIIVIESPESLTPQITAILRHYQALSIGLPGEQQGHFQQF
ncbi:hypothetical protein [Bacillus mesophilum]|uniref:DUF1269 domain-containing protein n=1 Tax=Bacillus mesophilum TaxID=1071718 RepID=A0A7V7RIX7_9BACI|nr:hypothetical protein [Bacillus mesophilum]KAB2330371.1 hypothetical protein F7732_19675 [Bacillus mesophilum]